MVLERNWQLLGKACSLFLQFKPKSPYINTLLKLAVQNQQFLTEEEKTEVFSEVLEKFPPGIAYSLGKKYLAKELQEEFFESLFLQNGRVSRRMKKKYQNQPIPQKLPEWMVRNPFGIYKYLKEYPNEAKPALDILKSRLPESYPAHTVLFVDAFMRKDTESFEYHYSRSGRVKYHPQSLYMKAIMDIKNGQVVTGGKLLKLIQKENPNWEVPQYILGEFKYASNS